MWRRYGQGVQASLFNVNAVGIGCQQGSPTDLHGVNDQVMQGKTVTHLTIVQEVQFEGGIVGHDHAPPTKRMRLSKTEDLPGRPLAIIY
jgi:hypothetical protein